MSAKILRRRCKHPNRTVIGSWAHTILRDHCPDCGARWPAGPVRRTMVAPDVSATE